jgi:hypothetical protein
MTDTLPFQNLPPCFSFSILPGAPQLPAPLDFSLGIGLTFPPAFIIALLNEVPCCKIPFPTFSLSLGFGIPLTPIIIAVNAIIRVAYTTAIVAAQAAGFPSTVNIPKCPF